MTPADLNSELQGMSLATAELSDRGELRLEFSAVPEGNVSLPNKTLVIASVTAADCTIE